MIRRYLLDTGIAQDFQDGRFGVRARAVKSESSATVSASACRSSESCGRELREVPVGT